MQNRLFLLDAYALIFRAYYALIKMPRVTQDGFNTSAIFGFVNTLEEVLRRENPTHIAVCFDPQGPTFRSRAFEEYKGERDATPEDIRLSVPVIKEVLKAYSIPVLEVEDFEADDVIGTMARRAEKRGFITYMMTPDKDFGQLVSPSILQYKPSYRGQDFEIRGEEEVCERYGLKRTEQVIDLLALMGDKIDNIPGCPGVGEKTAVKLIGEFDSVENLLEHTETLKGALRKKVEENAEQIRFSKYLATIRTDVPIEVEPEDLERKMPDIDALKDIFDRLEFRALSERVLRRMRDERVKAGATSASGALSAEDVSAGGKSSRSKEAPSNGKGGFIGSLFDFDNDAEQESDAVNAGDASASADADVRDSVAATVSKVTMVDSEASLEEMKRCIEDTVTLPEKRMLGVCILTAGDNDADCTLVGTALAAADGTGWYLPAGNAATSAVLLDIFAREDIIKATDASKMLFVTASRQRTDAAPALRNFYDVTLAHYLLQPEMRHGIELLASGYLAETLPAMPDYQAAIKGKRGAVPVAPAELALPATARALAALRLMPVMQRLLKQENMTSLYDDIEAPLVEVLADMELTGVRIDEEALNDAALAMEGKLESLEKEIHALAGEVFNVSSPSKVGEILFDRLGLDEKAKKTKTGQYSTSEEVLEKVAHKHPIVSKILEYRQLKKLLSTYLTALPAAVNPATGRVHTNYNQTVTATGRISSSNPNLQNIPVREDVGREIRRAFIPSEGNLFLSADYSQIELRLVADFAEDATMIDAFRRNADIHAITAAKIYHKENPADVTPEERRHAKTANFGILYGISAFGLASRLGIPRAEAKSLIDNYFESFHTIRKYMADSVEFAQEHGYVVTRFGRKRRLPDINSRNAVVRGYAERNAVNAPVQGTAADIIKRAMIAIYGDMKRAGMKSKMIMQVHDELNFDVVPSELAALQEIVEKRMQEAYSGKVPLTAESGVASNWLDAH